MTRIKPVTKDVATPELKQTYALIEKGMGRVPNIFQSMGNAPHALQAFLALSDAAGKTSIEPKLREEIALVVAETNQCNYCLAAHSAIGQLIGIKQEDILEARQGKSKSSKDQAILAFAKLVVEKKGHIADGDVEALKKAGVTEAQLVEIILVIMVNMFTNYFNHIADPQIDFPLAPKLV